MLHHKGYIDIEKPRDLVMDIFLDPAYQGKYQDGFISKTLLEGELNKEGAKSKILFSNKGSDMELIETIVENNLPESYEAFYHHIHMDNTMVCRFEALSETKTRYHYTYQYTRMTFMPKLMALVFPGMFKKPAEKWLKQFKELLESM